MKLLRAEAESHAGFLPGVLLEARRLAAAAPGVHGRRRAGPGEAFWQFRDHRPEDGARLVDWRRSARGDRLYVREREKEAAQSGYFWIDPGPGFAWKSDGDWPSKQRRALTLCLAFAILIARGGERIGALGKGQPMSGRGAIDRLAMTLTAGGPENPPAPPLRSAVVYASDFYAPHDLWDARLKAAAAAGAAGALLMISDPAEDDFPFRGHTLFQDPDGGSTKIQFGRAEAAQEEYARRLAAHRARMRSIARSQGFTPILHRTDRSAAPALSLLVAALSEHR